MFCVLSQIPKPPLGCFPSPTFIGFLLPGGPSLQPPPPSPSRAFSEGLTWGLACHLPQCCPSFFRLHFPHGLLIPASFSITTPSCANLPSLDPSTFPNVAHLCSPPSKSLGPAHFCSSVPLSPQGSRDAMTSTAQSQPQRSLQGHWVPRRALSTEVRRCLFAGDHLACLRTIDCQAQVSSNTNVSLLTTAEVSSTTDISMLTTAQNMPLAGPVASVPLFVVIPQCDR